MFRKWRKNGHHWQVKTGNKNIDSDVPKTIKHLMKGLQFLRPL